MRQVKLVIKPKTTLPQVLLRASAWPDPKCQAQPDPWSCGVLTPPDPPGPPLSQACIVLPVPLLGLPFQRDILDVVEKEELPWVSLKDKSLPLCKLLGLFGGIFCWFNGGLRQIGTADPREKLGTQLLQHQLLRHQDLDVVRQHFWGAESCCLGAESHLLGLPRPGPAGTSLPPSQAARGGPHRRTDQHHAVPCSSPRGPPREGKGAPQTLG